MVAPDNRVYIQYMEDVIGPGDLYQHRAGEAYRVTDAAAAKELHPEATIVGYVDGRPFDPAEDPTLLALAEAETDELTKAKAEDGYDQMTAAEKRAWTVAYKQAHQPEESGEGATPEPQQSPLVVTPPTEVGATPDQEQAQDDNGATEPS